MVKLVSESQLDPRTYAVTDGKYASNVARDLLTQDLSEAEAIQQRDQSQQDTIAQQITKSQNNFASARQDREFAQAKQVQAIETNRAASSGIGGKWSTLGDAHSGRDKNPASASSPNTFGWLGTAD